WEEAFAGGSATKFAEIATASVALEGSVFASAIEGRDAVFQAIRTTASLYDRLEFVHELLSADRTYMEWEAQALGLGISGVTVLTIASDGWLTRIALHHRPLGVVQRFASELEKRLTHH